jgi:tetratricopeptide (TPR) repeat protein
VSRKRKGKGRPRRRREQESLPGLSAAEYRRAVREADRVLAESGLEVRTDTWQGVALEWTATEERDRQALKAYMAAHEEALGTRWTRDLLRLEAFLQADDHEATLAHYERAMVRYPRCALVELWVGAVMMHHSTAWWRARSMLLYAAERLPENAAPCQALGLQHYLFGDFEGAVGWYDEGISRLVEDEADLAARLTLNRAVTHLAAGGDRKTAIAGVKKALRLKPDYIQAQEALRALRGKIRWTPW